MISSTKDGKIFHGQVWKKKWTLGDVIYVRIEMIGKELDTGSELILFFQQETDRPADCILGLSRGAFESRYTLVEE